MSVLSRIRRILRKSTLEVIPDVYQLSIGGSNIILIVEEELTLIDTGFRGSSPRIVDVVNNLGRSVEEISLIILTHSHFDHAGGLAELRKLDRVKIAAHKAEMADAGNQPFYTGGRQKQARNLPASALRSVLSVKLDEVDIPLEGGEVLKPLGGLEVIHTPGHTPGSISLFSPRNKLLIVGDALHKRRWLPPKLVSTDLAQAIDSVKKMARLDFEILCFGHGRPLTRGGRAKMQQLIENGGLTILTKNRYYQYNASYRW